RPRLRWVSVRPSAAGDAAAPRKHHVARRLVGVCRCGGWTQSRPGTLDYRRIVCHRRLLPHRRPARAAPSGLTNPRMLELLTDPQAGAPLVTLTILQIVLRLAPVAF